MLTSFLFIRVAKKEGSQGQASMKHFEIAGLLSK
jgi:hypothetical protein